MIFNEKIYCNGGEDYKVDICGIIIVFNELFLGNSSFDLIWDCFFIRLEMGNIWQFKNFLNMIMDMKDVYEDDVLEDVKFIVNELEVWSKEIDVIEVFVEVLNIIQVVKIKIEEYNVWFVGVDCLIDVYDWCWKKIVCFLCIFVFFNG